ncbi:protein GLUTAMINE DUMPER 1 [Brachypodium distachyon]|uniref:Uncharacterized protein n=1 Tax=Brachypodium distachyon TaxID=15368 RepID=I1I2B6_BRADI|nr:protein GLUTAMINE DUMPER 1 [Brachypodium distachyon]KQJ95792.1 hypothetical protein BRADI_3g19030v3 [Brachypodium distachyon]|eukprot:XP_003571580.1 protein GLUTAMINE DUMPER 1 [Brachypodium distachyon]
MRPIAGPAPTPAAAAAGVSAWQSPVPYLFGGLAAMMGLIALALLILACSYLKLNSYLGTGRASSSSAATGGVEGGDGAKSPAAAAPASPAAFADLVAVVMAGEKMPTFLAAPVVRRLVAGGEDSRETTENEKRRVVAVRSP